MSHTTIGGVRFLARNPGSSITHGGPPVANVIDIGPITIDPFPSGDCPPGTFRDPIFGTCIGLSIPDFPGGNGNGGNGFAPCQTGFARDFTGACVPILNGNGDPGTLDPAERGGMAADGPALPSRVARNVHVCPKFVDGSTGILYFSPLTNQIVCLPRSMTSKSALAFGLLRKNKPRAKAAVTAADVRLLNKVSSVQNRIGTLAAKADGLSCPKKKS